MCLWHPSIPCTKCCNVFIGTKAHTFHHLQAFWRAAESAFWGRGSSWRELSSSPQSSCSHRAGKPQNCHQTAEEEQHKNIRKAVSTLRPSVVPTFLHLYILVGTQGIWIGLETLIAKSHPFQQLKCSQSRVCLIAMLSRLRSSEKNTHTHPSTG